MNESDLSTHVKDPARLAALRKIALLDTPTEEAYDRLTRLAVTFVHAPTALVSLVDADRQFFKSSLGLPEPWRTIRMTPLSHSFCQHNRVANQPLLIEDARVHPLFKDNPAVPDLNVIAYLGFPLVTSDGYVLGTFCVIDSKPRRWTKEEIAVVQDLTATVMTEIQLRTEISARSTAEAERSDLTELNDLLRLEIIARKQAEEQLHTLKDELEERVKRRTSELQKIQSKYLHAEKLSAIGKLSASIAHEFNNPLQGIMAILKGLKRRVKMDEEDAELLDLSIAESERMKKLILDLQSFNRPSSLMKITMNVHDSLQALLSMYKSDFKKNGITTVLNYADRLPLILAIPDQIKQVFLNLLNNAVDACNHNGGEITISTWQEGKRIAVAIKDNGIGIEPEKIDLIFQPFYTTKSEVKGTGLGLSVCHGIVQYHEGEILVESRLGEGSTFTVLLPIYKA
ncbi:MAG: ATP-binding protein [Desulforhopalus sp.]